MNRTTRTVKDRSGTSHFKKQMKLDCSGGDIIVTEKTKKDKLKRTLRTFGRASLTEYCEMDCLEFDVGDDEIRPQATSMTSTKRFKLPKRFSDEVDHSSVPRKLRSVMKKRKCKSASPPLTDSKRLHKTIISIKSSKNDGLKKLKMKHETSKLTMRRGISGQITKDEEEVVETLYALAGMLSNGDMTANDESRLKGEVSEEKSSKLLEGKESLMPSLEVQSNGSNPKCPSTALEVPNPSFEEHSLVETVKFKVLDGPDKFQPEDKDLQTYKHIHLESDHSVQKDNLLRLPLVSISEPTDQKLLQRSLCFGPSSDCPETRLKYISQPEALTPERKPESGSWLTGILWSNNVQSPRTRKKDAKSTCDRKSLKRCETHIHLCRLIQDLQIRKRMNNLPIHPNQLRLDEEQKQGVSAEAGNLSGVKNGLIEARNGVPMDRMLHQGSVLPFDFHSIQKQKFDFLSLSPAVNEVMDANRDRTKREGNGSEPLQQNPASYWQMHMRNQTIMPFSLPQAYYHSSFQNLEQFSPPVSTIQQVPPFLVGLPCNPSRWIPPTTPKQQYEQQQQIWATQMAFQHRNWPNPATTVQILSWQNERNDPSLVQPSPSIFPHSSLSMEALYKHHSVFPQQQQQVMAIASSSTPSAIRRQQQHFPFG